MIEKLQYDFHFNQCKIMEKQTKLKENGKKPRTLQTLLIFFFKINHFTRRTVHTLNVPRISLKYLSPRILSIDLFQIFNIQTTPKGNRFGWMHIVQRFNEVKPIFIYIFFLANCMGFRNIFV